MNSAGIGPVIWLLIAAIVFGALIIIIVSRALRQEQKAVRSGARGGSATGHRKSTGRSVKRCPTCQNIYADETLPFCPSDGSTLERVPERPPGSQE